MIKKDYEHFHNPCVVLDDCPESQPVQSATARVLTGMGCRDYITPVLFHLLWLPICFWARFKLLALTCKNPLWSGTNISQGSPSSIPTYLLTLVILQGPALDGAMRKALVAPELWNSSFSEMYPPPSITVFATKWRSFHLVWNILIMAIGPPSSVAYVLIEFYIYIIYFYILLVFYLFNYLNELTLLCSLPCGPWLDGKMV